MTTATATEIVYCDIPMYGNIATTLTSGGLQSAASGGRFILDLASFRVVDPSGVTRLEEGNLAANGVSTGGYKFRANDSTGAPLFDSDGLISVMMQPAGSPSSPPVQSTTSTTDVVCTNSAITFTVVRQQSWLFLSQISAQMGIGAGNFGYFTLFLDGVSFSNYAIFDKANPGYSNATIIASQTLAAGSHTINLRFRVDNVANTLTLNAGTVYAFGLGS